MAKNNNILYPLANSFEGFIKTIYYNWNKLPNYCEYKVRNEMRIGNSLSLPIGEGKKDTIYLNINQSSCHTLVCGQTGGGKSNCIKVILSNILNLYSSVDLYLLDYKAVELNMFSSTQQCKMYEYDSELISEALNNLYNMIIEKYQDMMFKGKYKASVYDKTSILFVEEVSLASKQDIKVLQKILAISRAINFYVVLTTQRPSCDIISPVLKSLISNIICYKTSNKATSVICIEQEGAEELETVGRAYLKTDNSLVKFQTYYITDDTLKDVLEQNSKHIHLKENVHDDNNNESWLDNL